MKNNIVIYQWMAVIFIAVAFCSSCRKSNYNTDDFEIVVTDDGSGTGTVTWTNDKSYLLDGFVFVNDGQTLTIEAGTVIRAIIGQGENSSALIVARGGKIIAEGTAENPIIFTVQGDDLKGAIPPLTNGLWGGVIILGNARLNNSVGEAHIEGISIYDPRGIYGGNNDDDNSGIFKYVSIRHGGTNIGEGNEINGLTLGGVGRNTKIEFVEVFANADDGFEFFGGTVRTKHLIAAFCGDDAFDYENGFNGLGQFWFGIQNASTGDNMGEHNGGTDPVNGRPYAIPHIYNATYIGRRATNNSALLRFAANAGGIYANSIFYRQTKGVYIEYIPDREDCYMQFEHNNLQFYNNIFFEVADNNIESIFEITSAEGTDITEQEKNWQNHFDDAGNRIINPGLEIATNSYNILPNENTKTGLFETTNQWFETVNYKGAFGNTDWTKGWTLFYEYMNK